MYDEESRTHHRCAKASAGPAREGSYRRASNPAASPNAHPLGAERDLVEQRNAAIQVDLGHHLRARHQSRFVRVMPRLHLQGAGARPAPPTKGCATATPGSRPATRKTNNSETLRKERMREMPSIRRIEGWHCQAPRIPLNHARRW